MNILLLAFALPVATILLAIVLQKILKCPLLVAATFLAVLLIVTFAFFDATFLIFAIIYTILAYVTAILTRLICNLISRFHLNCNDCSCVCHHCDENRNNGSSRSGYTVANGTWCCRTKESLPQGRTAPIGRNSVIRNNHCICHNNGNVENEPVIVLTNTEQVMNSGKSGWNCQCHNR